MTRLSPEQLETFIEDYRVNRLIDQYQIYEQQLAKLTKAQLTDLLPYVHISYRDNNDVEEDELRRVMSEASWLNFIKGYKAVTGRDIAESFLCDYSTN